MRNSLSITVILLLTSSLCLARVDVVADRICRLEIGHFDANDGALRVHPDQDELLPDGVPIALFEDSDDDGRVSAADREFSWPESRRSLIDQLLRTNGEQRFDQAGFFFAEHLNLPLISHKIFVRVWNAESRHAASGSWVSPLTTLRIGVQQISFLREEWNFEPSQSISTVDIPSPLDLHASPPLAYETKLLGCYPNPFNLSTTVQFTLTDAATVHLEIFDVQGRRVHSTDEQYTVAGAHVLSVDGTGLSSGSYFVVLWADQRRAGVTRIQLLK